MPPMIPARLPSAMESAPSDGPTVRSSTIVNFVGSEPDSAEQQDGSCFPREVAGDLAEPPRIGSRMTGADSTLSSSTMAKGLPTLSFVKLPNLRAPDWLKRKLMTARCWRCRSPAGHRRDPRPGRPAVPSGDIRSGRLRPCRSGKSVTCGNARLLGILCGNRRVHFVERQLAVSPMSAFSSLVSLRPGNWIRMRSEPGARSSIPRCEIVDATVDRFDRGCGSIGDAARTPCIRRLDDDRAVIVAALTSTS